MNDTLTLQEAASTLRVTERTVRNWVRAGRLHPLSGGGRGIPYVFKKSMIEAFRKGLREIVRLAMCRHLWETMNGPQSDLHKSMQYLGAELKRQLWVLFGSSGKWPFTILSSVESDLLRKWTKAEAFPKHLLLWAFKMKQHWHMTVREMDYLSGVFVVMAYYGIGRVEHVLTEHKVDKVFQQHMERTNGQQEESRAALYTAKALVMAIRQNDSDAIMELTDDGLTKDDISSGQPKGPFPELKPFRSAIMSLSRKRASEWRAWGKGKPSGAQVATVLGISRTHGSRLWKSIAHKLGRQGLRELGKVLSGDVWIPRLWKKSLSC